MALPSAPVVAFARGEGDLFAASLVFHAALCLVMVSFRNLGWDTRAWAGRTTSTAGQVLSSRQVGEPCTKGMRCMPRFASEIRYEGPDGQHVLSYDWVEAFQPGAYVRVEHAQGRPQLARIANTVAIAGTPSLILTGVCGLGVPLFVGGITLLVSAWSRGARPRLRVLLVWLGALSVEVVLATFLYWL